MINPVDLGRVGEPARLLVQQHRSIFPGVPQLGCGLHELVGHVIAVVVLQVLRRAEILGLGVVEGGHNVPGNPALGEVVQRGEQPGHVEGRVIGGGVGGAQTQVFGRQTHGGDDRD